jgi:hypothetical protein
MSTAEATELTDVLNRVAAWPTTLRIALARKILETLETADSPTAAPTLKTRGLSAVQVRALLKTDRSPPDDDTVKRWVDVHLVEKYGG